MDFITFYNKNGKAIAYLSERDDETIYLFNGTPVAYIYDCCVYSFKGKHIGWYENGWIYDNNGYCVFFTQNATGGPVKPVKSVMPVRSTTRVKPIKSVKAIKPVKPIKRLSWNYNSDNFFE